MNDDLGVVVLCKSVRDLVDDEPKSKSELLGWYKKAQKVKDLIVEIEGKFDVPHFLLHYLDDADIRIKDPRYAAAQIEAVLLFLENNEVKKDMGG